jgi:hypothetical protein
MGLFDFIRGRGSGDGVFQDSANTSNLGDAPHNRSAFDEVAMHLSAREYRHAIRVLQPGYEIDVHSVLRGEPVVGLPSSAGRHGRSVYGVMVELDNGNILMVRHRTEEGVALGVLSARGAKGQVIPPEQKTFRVRIGSELGDSFSVDPTVKVCGFRIVGERLLPSELGMYQEDSLAEVYNSLILNPEKKVMCEHLATGVIEEAYVKTSTGKIYRLHSGGDGTVAAESAFHIAHKEPSSFTVRMESFHVGQKVTLCDVDAPSKAFETSKIVEFATLQPGAQADDNFETLQRHFNLQADPSLEDKTAPLVKLDH